VTAVALAAGIAGCTAAGPSSSAQSAEVRQQAKDALARWDAAVAKDPAGSSFVLVGEQTLMIGDDWGPNIDGGNAKLAWYAGLFETASPLPIDTPPDAQVHWPNGTTGTVHVISAQRAFDDLKGSAAQPCPECTPLQVTGAKLTTATFTTSRGPVQAPAWEFSLKDTPVKLDQIAVDNRFAPPAAPTVDGLPTEVDGKRIGPRVESATLDATGLKLTANVVGAGGTADKPCGADYTAQAFESDNGVVVVVFEHPNPTPAACTLEGHFRTATVTLTKPLGSRTVLDLAAQPISVTAAH
jgi:hypothetical protein